MTFVVNRRYVNEEKGGAAGISRFRTCIDGWMELIG